MFGERMSAREAAGGGAREPLLRSQAERAVSMHSPSPRTSKHIAGDAADDDFENEDLPFTGEVLVAASSLDACFLDEKEEHVVLPLSPETASPSAREFEAKPLRISLPTAVATGDATIVSVGTPAALHRIAVADPSARAPRLRAASLGGTPSVAEEPASPDERRGGARAPLRLSSSAPDTTVDLFLVRQRELDAPVAARAACAVPPRRVVVADPWETTRDSALAAGAGNEFAFVLDPSRTGKEQRPAGTWSVGGGVDTPQVNPRGPPPGSIRSIVRADVARIRARTESIDFDGGESGTESVLSSPVTVKSPIPRLKNEALKKHRRGRRERMRQDLTKALDDAVDNIEASHPPPLLLVFLFCVCGHGISLPWYCVSGTIGLWTELFGADAYGHLLGAYNTGALVMLAVQAARIDENLMRCLCRFRTRAMFVWRICIAYLVMASICVSLAFRHLTPGGPESSSYWSMVVTAFIIGLFDSVLYGCLAQLAAIVAPRCSSAVLVGQSLSAPALLVVQVLLGVGTTGSTDPASTRTFFLFSGGGTLLCLVAFVVLSCTTGVRAALDSAEQEVEDAKHNVEMAAAVAWGADEGAKKTSGSRCLARVNKVIPVDALCRTAHSQAVCCCAFLFMLACQASYPRVPSRLGTEASNAQLSVLLVYSKYGGEFIGRQLSAVTTVQTALAPPSKLLALTLMFMPAYVGCFYVYAGAGSFPFVEHLRHDAFIVTGCFVLATYEGLSASLAYVFVASGRFERQLRAHATSWLNLLLVAGCVGGVAMGTALGNALLGAA